MHVTGVDAVAAVAALAAETERDAQAECASTATAMITIMDNHST